MRAMPADVRLATKLSKQFLRKTGSVGVSKKISMGHQHQRPWACKWQVRAVVSPCTMKGAGWMPKESLVKRN